MDQKCDSTNRKDASPERTISNIEEHLRSIGIKICEVQSIQHKGMWYSTRIEIEGLRGIGANGKGVTREYALASAYAELMERLQTGMLLGKYFPNKLNVLTERYQGHEAAIGAYRKYMSTWFNEWTDESLTAFIEKYPDAMNCVDYFDIKTGEIVQLPRNMIDFVSGTNGLAAGNTLYEAYVQGMFEIFERYVLKKIYASDINLRKNFHYIARRSLEDLDSYHLLEEIEAQGYTCKVIDCSMGNCLPVLGLLILNAQNHRYIFTMAADFDAAICLQRCVTEMFQGRAFDASFRFELQKSLEYNFSESFENNLSHSDFLKSFSDHSGQLPLGMFLLNTIDKGIAYPFVAQTITNKECVLHLKNITRTLNIDVYIHDASILGFPTLRMYVPGMSDCLVKDTSDMEQIIEAQVILRSDLHACKLDKKYEALACLSRNVSSSGNSPSMYLGILASPEALENIYLADYDSALMRLSLAQKKWATAYEHMRATNHSKERIGIIGRIREIAIVAISEKVAAEDFVDAMSQFADRKNVASLYEDMMNEYHWMHCETCVSCLIKDGCMYDDLQDLHCKLTDKLKEYNASCSKYKDDFYRSVVTN